jgi:hypothetical protein
MVLVCRVSDRSTGLPNVGKSSFFNVLSDTGEYKVLHVPAVHSRPVTDLGKAANFPYATINVCCLTDTPFPYIDQSSYSQKKPAFPFPTSASSGSVTCTSLHLVSPLS